MSGCDAESAPGTNITLLLSTSANCCCLLSKNQLTIKHDGNSFCAPVRVDAADYSRAGPYSVKITIDDYPK